APQKKKPALRQTELAPVRGIDLPFADSHKDAIHAQCERVVVSCNLAEGFFEQLEVQSLFKMFRSRAADVLPSRRLIGERLLNDAAAIVDKKVIKNLEGKNIGIQSDGWSRFRRGITGVCGIRPGRVTTLKLINTTATNKDGESMAAFFAKVIDEVETMYSCYIIYFVMDTDGGSKKGRMILLKLRPDLFLPSCFAHQSQLVVGDYFKEFPFALDIAEQLIDIVNWINNHDKVRDIFDRAQRSVSADENQGRVTVLSYFTANLTRWTTHATSFIRVLRLKRALTQAAILHKAAIVTAQVGAAKSTEKIRLEEEARLMITWIVDCENRFWLGVETVIGDLEPICFGTNINQQDDVQPDQVLLVFVGMFLHFAEHPEDEVRRGMVKRLEKRWKDADQPMFLLALLFNPFEGLSAFGPDAGLNPFMLVDLLLTVYRRTQNRPGNPNSIATRIKKENAIEDAFFAYLASTGMYKNFCDKMESWIKRRGKCPLTVWQHALSSADLGEQELCSLAILLLEIVCNTAGAERLFSNLKIHLSDRRARTGLEKLEKKAKVCGESIHREHISKGLIKTGTRKHHNHADASSLLAVPR
ncbi:ribonuclease H-like domain-containing protein, partial [Mycena sp. CBHHK59/15]